MKYKKINDATVQCIVSADDMAEYGLALSDIFERSERGEEFLRIIIERAHDEVGYQINGGNIAMQITPLKNDGLVVTFTDERPADFRGMLQHIKEALQSLSEELIDQEISEKAFDDSRHMFVFASLHQVMQYAAAIPNTYSVRSHLFKEGEDYYLVLEKHRLSYKNFNKFCAQAVEFGNLIEVSDERLRYLEEHGECLIRNCAVSRLRKIYQS